MIEEKENRLPLFTRVYIPEIDASGKIYERGTSDSGDTIYGVELDEIAFPPNFVATTVWHVERERLVTG